MPDHIQRGPERIPLLPGRWYLGQDNQRQAVARLLIIEPEREAVVLCSVQGRATWPRMSQRTRSVPLADFSRLLVQIQPEEFEPHAVYLRQPMLKLGRIAIPTEAFSIRVRAVMDAHPEHRSDMIAISKRLETRPIWAAEELAARTGASLRWLLLGVGHAYTSDTVAHRWEYYPGPVRRCARCGYHDELNGAAPLYCHGSEVAGAAHAGK